MSEATTATAAALANLVWGSPDTDGAILDSFPDEKERTRIGHELRCLRAYAVHYAADRLGDSDEKKAVMEAYYAQWEEWGRTDAIHKAWVSTFDSAIRTYGEAVRRSGEEDAPQIVGKAFESLCCDYEEGVPTERDPRLVMAGMVVFATVATEAESCLRTTGAPLMN